MDIDEHTTAAEKRLDMWSDVINKCKAPVKASDGVAIRTEFITRIIACDEAIKETSVELDLLYMEHSTLEKEMIHGCDPLTDEQWDQYKLLEELMDYGLMIIVSGKKLLRKLIMHVIGRGIKNKTKEMNQHL